MSYQRLTNSELPPYAFLPGSHPHPEKEGGHGFGTELKTHAISEENFQDHQDYLYSIDLLNLGYYWESHVYLEAIWNQNGRKGNEADLLKALIKIGAAGVKYRMDMNEAGDGHLKRALELFNSLPKVTIGINGLNYLENLLFDKEKTLFNKELILNTSKS